jgi:hypothetical protein
MPFPIIFVFQSVKLKQDFRLSGMPRLKMGAVENFAVKEARKINFTKSRRAGARPLDKMRLTKYINRGTIYAGF